MRFPQSPPFSLLLPLLGLPALASAWFFHFSVPALAFIVLAAYAYGLGAAAAAYFGRGLGRAAVAAALAYSFALVAAALKPGPEGLPPGQAKAYLTALAAMYLASALLLLYSALVLPATLYGRMRLVFAFMLFLTSAALTVPISLLPLPAGLIFDPTYYEIVLRQDPARHLLNWIRYILYVYAHYAAIHLARKAVDGLYPGPD